MKPDLPLIPQLRQPVFPLGPDGQQRKPLDFLGPIHHPRQSGRHPHQAAAHRRPCYCPPEPGRAGQTLREDAPQQGNESQGAEAPHRGGEQGQKNRLPAADGPDLPPGGPDGPEHPVLLLFLVKLAGYGAENAKQ